MRLICGVVGKRATLALVNTTEEATVYEVVNEYKALAQLHCNVSDASVYLAQRYGHCLSVEESYGILAMGGYQRLSLRDTLSDCGLTHETTREEKWIVHILVDILLFPRSGDPPSLTWSDPVECPPLCFDLASPLAKIPWLYVEGSGVGTQGLLLYLRPAVLEEWKAIRLCSMDACALLRIYGAPGVGKSCAAFPLACTIDRTNWDVVWLNVHRTRSYTQCIWFSGANKRTCKVDNENARYLTRLLASARPHTVVFLDGYQKLAEAARRVFDVCKRWQDADRVCHRFVCVSSMASFVKDDRPDLAAEIGALTDMGTIACSLRTVLPPSPSDEEMCKEMAFHMPSWTLEEYTEAIAHDEFLDHVRNKLCSPDEEPHFVAEDSAVVMATPSSTLDLSRPAMWLRVQQAQWSVSREQKKKDQSVWCKVTVGCKTLKTPIVVCNDGSPVWTHKNTGWFEFSGGDILRIRVWNETE